MSRLLAVLLLSLFAFAVRVQAAPPEGKGNPHKAQKTSHAPAFRAKDRDVVRAFYAKNPGALPPGLAKQRKIPPGQAKKGKITPAIFKGQVVSADIKKDFQPLPPALETQLPPAPKDHMRVIFGNDVLMVEVKTNKVLDVLKDALR